MFTLASSPLEEIAEELPGRLPAHVADGARQRHLFRTYHDAVLRVAAVDDAAHTHELRGALLLGERSARVEVLEHRLPDRRRTDEGRVIVDLRARLETAAAGHTTRQRVRVLLLLLADTRPRTEIVRTV